jgi:hypothetical protein
MKNTAEMQAGRLKIIQELKLKTLSQKFMFYKKKNRAISTKISTSKQRRTQLKGKPAHGKIIQELKLKTLSQKFMFIKKNLSDFSTKLMLKQNTEAERRRELVLIGVLPI